MELLEPWVEVDAPREAGQGRSGLLGHSGPGRDVMVAARGSLQSSAPPAEVSMDRQGPLPALPL